MIAASPTYDTDVEMIEASPLNIDVDVEMAEAPPLFELEVEELVDLFAALSLYDGDPMNMDW